MIRLSNDQKPVSELAIADPDVRLMLRVADDESEAFEQLMLAYEHRVRGVLCRLMGRQSALIDDLTQDVFLRVYRSRKAYQPKSRFSNWLFTIVHNVASNAKRGLSRRRESQWVGYDDDSRGDPGNEIECRAPGPSAQSLQNETTQLVKSAINRLQGRQRQAIRWNRLEGLSLQDVALRMGTTTDAVKSLLARARRQLKTLLPQP